MERILLSDPKITGRLLQVVEAGGVVIVPTDTVYGLVADATNESAVKKIYKIKKRELSKPLGLFVSGHEMLDEYAEIEEELSKKLFLLWPGALTAILRAKRVSLPMQGASLGFRVPSTLLLIDLINKLARPLIQTSANVSGHGPFVRVQDVEKDFWDAHDVDLFIDGGDIPDSMASSAVDFTTHPPTLIREGDISREKLEHIFGSLQ